MKISVVIPVHNEEKNIPVVYKETKEVLELLAQTKAFSYEIIFVNDGSSDNSLNVLKNLKKSDPFLRILNMDKNRGQSAALSAGFYYATGDIIVSMDGDGQNDPKYIKNLIENIEKGYKVVTGYRLKRKEPFLTRILPSRIANWIISKITGLKVRDNGCSLKAYLSPIPKKYQIPHGFHRFLPALFGVKNNDVCEIPIIDRPRLYGKSHYNLKRTFEVLRDLLTIPFILKNPQKYEKFWKYFFYFFLTLSLLNPIAATTYFKLWLLEIPFSLLTVLSFVIQKNLNRFNKAQINGVFKVEEI